jgi:hypothetical protein
MTKKQVLTIFLLTLAAFAVLIVGEIIIGLVFNLGRKVSVVWALFVVIADLALNVFVCCFNDKDSKRKKNSRKW